MYMLQLFDSDDDRDQPFDARLLATGSLTIGRDHAADWPIADEECLLSRTHCELVADGDGLSIVPLGANGLFDEEDRRLADGERCAIALPATLRLGRFRLVANHAPELNEPGSATRTMILSPPLGETIDTPTQWEDVDSALPQADGSLFDAFCDGARIDPSLLAGEDPEEIMRRAGALYRQMVLGLGSLMAERTEARERHQLSRTTIGGDGNNLVKWAPSQRLAVDLLLSETEGFLSGPAAVRASLRDLKLHLAASFAGLQGSLREAVESFAPERIERAARDRGGLLHGRGAAKWNATKQTQADLAEQIDGAASGSLDRAFVRAYNRTEGDLAQKAPE